MGLLDSMLGSVLNGQPGGGATGTGGLANVLGGLFGDQGGQAGFGNAGDLLGMLGGVLQKA